MPLELDINSATPDDIYQSIVDMHAGLDDRESQKANARLILILANHIGDPAVIAEAAHIARGDFAEGK